MEGRDVTEDEEDQAEGMLVAEIHIQRWIGKDGSDGVVASFSDNNGGTPTLVETLGMLELTKDTAIRIAMNEDEEEGE